MEQALRSLTEPATKQPAFQGMPSDQVRKYGMAALAEGYWTREQIESAKAAHPVELRRAVYDLVCRYIAGE